MRWEGGHSGVSSGPGVKRAVIVVESKMYYSVQYQAINDGNLYHTQYGHSILPQNAQMRGAPRKTGVCHPAPSRALDIHTHTYTYIHSILATDHMVLASRTMTAVIEYGSSSLRCRDERWRLHPPSESGAANVPEGRCDKPSPRSEDHDIQITSRR